jgi:hypothetical protein
MKDILNYENREELFKFLIDDFGLIKLEERYDPKNFGNFLIELSAKDFVLIYINDRSFLTIDIASKLDPDSSYALSFVKDFIYNPDNINSDDKIIDNQKRIEELNNFLKKDFDKICNLFNSTNYYNTKKQIDALLMQQFKRRNPGVI